MNIVLRGGGFNVKTECVVLPVSIVGENSSPVISTIFSKYPDVLAQYLDTFASNSKDITGLVGCCNFVTIDNDGIKQDIALVYCRSPMGNDLGAYLNGLKTVSARGYKSVTLHIPSSLLIDSKTIDEANKIFGECQVDIWVE